ncbi:hypothetical protein [Abyssisolibacter fermentans]|nr:hypothetical protein [Abyssisolibacter fermentans]
MKIYIHAPIGLRRSIQKILKGLENQSLFIAVAVPICLILVLIFALQLR